MVFELNVLIYNIHIGAPLEAADLSDLSAIGHSVGFVGAGFGHQYLSSLCFWSEPFTLDLHIDICFILNNHIRLLLVRICFGAEINVFSKEGCQFPLVW